MRTSIVNALSKVLLAKLPLLENKSPEELTPDLLKTALGLVLKSSGKPAAALLAPLSLSAIKWMNDKYHVCGAENADPPDGDPLEKSSDGNFVIRVFVEEVSPAVFKLPAVTGAEGNATVDLMMAAAVAKGWKKKVISALPFGAGLACQKLERAFVICLANSGVDVALRSA